VVKSLGGITANVEPITLKKCTIISIWCCTGDRLFVLREGSITGPIVVHVQSGFVAEQSGWPAVVNDGLYLEMAGGTIGYFNISWVED